MGIEFELTDPIICSLHVVFPSLKLIRLQMMRVAGQGTFNFTNRFGHIHFCLLCNPKINLTP